VALLALTICFGLIQMKKNFIDYEIYENAARKIISRDLNQFYEPERLSPQGNYYPYFWAVLFVPFVLFGNLSLQLLGEGWGQYLGRLPFMLLFAGSYFYLIHFSWKNVYSEKFNNYLFKVMLILPTLFLINDAFMNSNIGVVLAAMLVFSFEQREKRPILASFVLAAATVIKIYPALLWGFYFWERRFKQLIVTFLFSVFFYFGIPLMVEGWEKMIELSVNHRMAVANYDRQNGWAFDNPVFQNLPGTLMRYASMLSLSKVWAYRLSLGFPLLAVAIFLWPSFVKNMKSKISIEKSSKVFSLFMSLVPLLTPVSWFNMALFYLPMIAWVLKRALIEKKRSSQYFFLAFIVFYCLTTRDLVGVELCRKLQYYSVPFFGLLMLQIDFFMDLKKVMLKTKV